MRPHPQLFRVIFSTTNSAWSINTSIWAFKAIRWVLIHGLMLSKGYAAYIKVQAGVAAAPATAGLAAAHALPP